MNPAPEGQTCKNSDPSGDKNVFSKQVQVSKEKGPTSSGMTEKHYCNPIIVNNNGIIQTWPSCNSFRKNCNGGDYGEIREEDQKRLEWIYTLGPKRQDVEFGDLNFQDWYKIRYGNARINEEVVSRFRRDFDNHFIFTEGRNCKETITSVGDPDKGQCSYSNPGIVNDHSKEHTSPDEKPQGYELCLNEWMIKNWGTTKVDTRAKVKAFVEWMVENDQGEAKPPDHKPYERSFENFSQEFESEVLELLDNYNRKIGEKGIMLSKMWDYCEETYNGKRSFWHKNELEALEVQECQIKGIKYEPPEIQMETFKIRRYTVGGIGRILCTEKAMERALPIGRMNGEKFKAIIRDEIIASNGIEPP